MTPPVKIGILETPTGFEVNAIHSWPARMKSFYEKRLTGFRPDVTMIRAWRKDGENSTNDPRNAELIEKQDFIYCGAGSPSYTINHLRDSLVWQEVITAHKNGTTICLGSATAIAVGKQGLPVYEIFKAGHDLFWLEGLNLFGQYALKMVVIPHWNNREGEDFDTTRCYMGRERFDKLVTMLPGDEVIIGIDEQTAAVFDLSLREVEVMGLGTVTVRNAGSEKTFKSGEKFPTKFLC